jgi:hypothetical protein
MQLTATLMSTGSSPQQRFDALHCVGVQDSANRRREDAKAQLLRICYDVLGALHDLLDLC